MTFDLEKAREVCKTLPKYMNGACPCKEEAEAAKMLIKALPEIEQLREANTNFACRACDQAQEIERLQEFRDRVARILKQPLTDCDDLLILGLGARICQLRRQAAEIERLRASLIDLHAEYINTLEKNPECSAWDLDEQSDADQKRLRRNAAHAISIVEPPIYLQAEQRATKIKELEDALAEERAKVIMLIEKLQLVANDPDWQSKGLKHDFDWYLAESKKEIESGEPEDQRCRRLEEPNWGTDPEGKIGPDARPKCDHAWQAAIEERGYQTCLKCGECRNIEDIPRTPAWQITEDRVTAIDQGLRFLEWSNAKTGHVETKKRIAILKTMLEEASDEHGFER